jgi:hypothetical protein
VTIKSKIKEIKSRKRPIWTGLFVKSIEIKKNDEENRQEAMKFWFLCQKIKSFPLLDYFIFLGTFGLILDRCSL